MFGVLGRWCFERRRLVAGLWIVGLVALFATLSSVGSRFDGTQQIPDSETRDGFDTLERYFGGLGAGATGSIVFRAEAGVANPDVQSTMEALFAEVDALPEVTVSSPYEGLGPVTQVAQEGEYAGQVAFADLELGSDVDQTASSELGREIAAMLPTADGIQIEVGGAALAEFEPPESELIGVAFAIVVLIMAFGSVLAMGLPIGVALAGVGAGIGTLTLASNVITMPDMVTTIAAMIGLGVGIDYALFIVTRYREALHQGTPPAEAAGVAIDTAGRSVIFAGITVVVSLLGMLLIGLPFVSGMGIGAALTVAVTMLASITLLPALLGFAGHRVEVTRYRGLIAAGLVALGLLGVGLGVKPLLLALPAAVAVMVLGTFPGPLKAKLKPRARKPNDQTFAYRWSRMVQSHPWAAALGSTALLLALAVPVLGMRLGFSDEGNYSQTTTTRQAYDLLADAFGPGFNGPFVMTAELSGPQDLGSLQPVIDAVAATPGVASVSPAIPDDAVAPQAAVVRIIPTTAPQDDATTSLVRHLWAEVVPEALAGSELAVNITGGVPAQVDFTDYLSGRLPLFFAAVLTLSFVLLMMVFRSLLVPLKAVVMNLLSIGAAYGIVVAVFQWGWGAGLLGVDAGAPIEPFLPMMMFAIVFGLSMDYEVFLLSRVKEEFVRTGDPVESVADGLAVTARVITAAAAIMVVVFGSFMFEDDRIVKLFGMGLATAVLLDATIVRMLLVPATMELLGARNWWLPRWLDRVLPQLNVEGGTPHPVSVPAAATAPAPEEVPSEGLTAGDRKGEPVGARH